MEIVLFFFLAISSTILSKKGVAMESIAKIWSSTFKPALNAALVSETIAT